MLEGLNRGGLIHQRLDWVSLQWMRHIIAVILRLLKLVEQSMEVVIMLVMGRSKENSAISHYSVVIVPHAEGGRTFGI